MDALGIQTDDEVEVNSRSNTTKETDMAFYVKSETAITPVEKPRRKAARRRRW